MKKEMSKGLRNRLLRNRRIYEITIKELQNKDNKYIGHFTYPETLEFSMSNIVLRRTNLSRLKLVVAKIRKVTKWKGDSIKGISIKELERSNKRKLKREDKLKEHLEELNRLRNIRGSQNKRLKK